MCDSFLLTRASLLYRVFFDLSLVFLRSIGTTSIVYRIAKVWKDKTDCSIYGHILCKHSKKVIKFNSKLFKCIHYIDKQKCEA